MGTYEHGNQNISAHRETFHGIMELIVWSAGFIIMAVLLATMIFAAKVHWLAALIVTMIVGIGMGMFLKKGGAWHGTVIGLGLFVLILGWGISVLNGLG